MTDAPDVADTDIAIVGMAGRFPGAPDVDALWRRVAAGEDCLVDLDADALIAAGLPAELVRDPDYVLRTGLLADVDMFDNELFGIGARDASIMDPQHRVFLECVWEAIESAGHVPERFEGAVGVFAGCGFDTYLINNLITNPKLVDQIGWFLLRHTSNDKDFLPTFVSYKLDLRGPSVSVQTACSTSLVAIHLAAQSLISFECDMAVAGGSTIEIPQGVGYRFQEGEVLSPDGHCRAFEAGSAGTVLTSGAGVVVLRRLADAIDDGDPILAVVKGTAVNNDGGRKVGFLAPSVDGHADVVKEALALAGLSARDITLVDAHGTGTAVGDPIEVAALTEAFRATTAERGFCRLTSTKPNIGHLDTAAGVASVIKTVQALRHRTIPPLANFTTPNPLLDLDSSPFVISNKGSEWPGDRTRRAGVSSLGVGGTNAHAILEEAPELPASEPSRPEQVLCLSGRSPSAVSEASERLATFLEANPDVELADVAHTLIAGRRAMSHRRIVTVTDVASAGAELRAKNQRRSAGGSAPLEPPGVAFMFPGGGSQYAGMGAGLDHRFDVFHDVVGDGTAEVLRLGGPDLAPLLDADGDGDALRQVEASLPAVFVTSVALARQWMAWGVQPDVLLGHSLGEYVAAHLAGVMSFEDALSLVVGRSRLIRRASGTNAGMLAVPLPEDDVRALLPEALSLSVINTADECVVSGPADVIDDFAAQLEAKEVTATRLKIVAAGHSSMLDPILDEFREVVARISLSPPTMPYLSNLTGGFVTPEQATDPQAWVDHLRGTVRFHDNLAAMLAMGPMVTVELGPGQALSSYARRQPVAPVATIPALRHPDDTTPDTAHTLTAFSRQWIAGLPVDLDRFAGTGRRRLRLPTYPFQRQRHWIDPGTGLVAAPAVRTDAGVAAVAAPAALTRIGEVADWFWEPAWTEAARLSAGQATGSWLVIGRDSDGLGDDIAAELRLRGVDVTIASELTAADLDAASAVVLVGSRAPSDVDLGDPVGRWIGDAGTAVRSLGSRATATLAVVTTGATDAGGLATRPVDALAMGVVRVAPREYPDLRSVLVDLDAEAPAPVKALVDELVAPTDSVVALRGGRRLVPTFERRRVDAPTTLPFREEGTYLVTGGLGDIGFAVARHLASTYRANLVVVSSTPIPEGAEREQWLASHGSAEATSRRIRRAMELESAGTKVAIVTADLADPASVARALDEGEQRVGRFDGAIHLAGTVRDRLIELASDEDQAAVLGAKSRGAAALLDELRRRGAELLVLMSSTSSFLGAEGQAAYVAANSYLDALAGQRDGVRVVTMNSGAWAGTGMAAEMARRLRLGLPDDHGEPVTHPVLTERHTERDGAVSFLGRLDTSADWVVDEHRTGEERALLPGTGHLDLMLAAVRLAGLDGFALRDVMLVEPLVVPDDLPVTVRVTVDPKGPHGTHAVLVESDRGYGKAWHLHSQAGAGPPLDTASRVAVDATPDTAIDPLAGPKRLLQFGPHWDAVDHASSDGTTAVARLALNPAYRIEAESWLVHPALLDVATALAVSLRSDDGGDAVMVPVGYEAVTLSAPLPAEVDVVAQRRADSSHDVLIADLTLADTSGRTVLDIEGLTLHAVADTGNFAVLDDTDIATPLPAAGSFVELAERLGIRDRDAGTIFERLVAAGSSRLVVSSVDIAELDRPVVEEVAPAPTEPGAASGIGGVNGALLTMWTELLGVDDITEDDNFFDLGGHSLIAIRLMARIHRELEVRLQLATLFDAPTVSALADLIRAEKPDLEERLQAPAATAAPGAPPATDTTTTVPTVSKVRKTLIPMNRDGTGTPLTVVHGGGGNVLFLSPLARLMKGQRPLNGLQAVGIDAGDEPDQTVEAMAERYVTAMRADRPGPYMVGGYSGGGIVAMEIAHQLQEAGEVVKCAVLIDSIPAGLAYPETKAARINTARNILRSGWKPMSPYLKSRIGRRIAYMLRDRDTDSVELDPQREFWDVEREDLGFIDLFDHFAEISLGYEMPVYDVDVILLKADYVWPYQPHDYYWQRHISRKMVIVPTPGDHHTMVVQPCVTKLWERLKPLLDRFDSA